MFPKPGSVRPSHHDEWRIPSTYTRIIARELQLQTKDLPRLLASTQLDASQLLQADSQLTARQQIQVMENALGLTNDPAFGLILGRALSPSTHGAMGYLASCSPHVLAALEAIRDYLPTRMGFVRIEIEKSEHGVTCQGYFDIDASEAVQRLLAEVCAMVFFSCVEFIIGRPAHEAEMQFAYPAPSYRTRYGEFLPGKVRFAADCLTAWVPPALCEIENVSANQESYRLAKAQCETILAQLNSTSGSYQRQIEQMLLSHPAGFLTEDEAAAALFMSKRTLARRLQAEGTRFRKIRDEIFARQASGYLRDSRLSVDAIAALLNYHDSANFRRAFKRWFQMTPDEFRKSL